MAVPAVVGVVVAVIAGCSSTSSPPTSSSRSSSTSSAAPASASSPSATSSSSASSSSKQADDPLPDPAALLKESSKSTKDLKSAHLALSVTGKIAEMPVKTLGGELTTQPGAAAQGDAKITIMGADVGIKFVEFDRRMYASLPGGAWRDYGPTSQVYDVAAILNPDTGLANLLSDFIDPKAEARETVDGQETIRVSGKVTADAVNKIVPLDASKKMSTTVWIQESGDHQLVKAKLEPSKDNAIEMVLSNWNVPVTIDKPTTGP
ncbi:Lipoarabinomannan carrier protein LprG [Mycobacterium talmoniae]|uniref:Lipoarabinomannan carrier protein LprG n=1 Tax=Mycobacterium talmoniae TaxID=1858794 RepID=A0A2S8BLT0_9MYCO|nr:Lipoarabinomannan carrier protein LprG [Mycobacterium talmoniae]